MISKKKAAVIAVLSAIVAAIITVCSLVMISRYKEKEKKLPVENTGTAVSDETGPATSADVSERASLQPSTEPVTSSAPETTAPPAIDTGKIVTPTEKELEELCDVNGFLEMLNYTFMPNHDGRVVIDFDSEKLDTASLKDYLFFLDNSKIYLDYFGRPENKIVDFDDGSTYSVCAFLEDNILWLARNVLNYTGVFDREVFENDTSGNANKCIYKDGVFYFGDPGYDNWQAFPDTAAASSLGDGKYKVTVTYMLYALDRDTEELVRKPFPGEGEVIVALKEADGKRFWSVYSYKADLNVPNFTDPA